MVLRLVLRLGLTTGLVADIWSVRIYLQGGEVGIARR